jgi:hypothetical protein
MKLYTEEEIVSFLKREFSYEINPETFMENLTPIELPSDEEIEKRFNRGNETNDPLISTFIGGQIFSAIWMRDKIQGDNK